MSRTENFLKNVKAAFAFRVIVAIVNFSARKVFVMVLTTEYLGLNGVFSNILELLSLSELGIGSAITYSLYKPLAEDDREQVASLMALYRRVYRVVGVLVILLGGALAPFLPLLIRDMPDIPHIYLIYMIFVLNSALSYFYAYKQSLIGADQRQYIVTAYQGLLHLAATIAQVALLLLTRNYFAYLGVQTAVVLAGNIVVSRKADLLYPYLKTIPPRRLDPEVKEKIVQNSKALILHNLSGFAVFGTDNLLMSAFVGAAVVGLYSNYLLVANSLASVYDQLFTALTASVGNLSAEKSPEEVLPVFWRIQLFSSWLYGFSAVCLAVLLNPFITLWLGVDYRLSQSIVWLIALNFYTRGMRKTVLTFRTAYGLYWRERFKPLAESLINLAASIGLAIPFGVAGVLVGTLISTMTTCFWVEPTVLFKYGFRRSAKPYFQHYAFNTLVTLLTTGLVWYLCSLLPGTGLLPFLGKMAICASAGNLIYLAVYSRREEFRYFTGLIRHYFM